MNPNETKRKRGETAWRSPPLRLRWVQVAWLGAALVGLAVGHMALARGTHLLHVIHLTLTIVYLTPVLGAALWFGLRGGVLAGSLATAAFLIHVRLVWSEPPIHLTEWEPSLPYSGSSAS
jgi:ABC-type amino acid transport system permease subunit